MAAETQRTLTPAEVLTLHLRRWCPDRAHARHLAGLELDLGIDQREIQDLAREARAGGAPICSSSCGYWYSEADHRDMAYRQIRRGLAVLTNGKTMLEACALPSQEPLLTVLPRLLEDLDADRDEPVDPTV